jgi:hypothetical protein
MKKGSVFGLRRSSGNDVHTTLAPSISGEFAQPAYPITEENGLSPQEREARILQLTSAAKQLLKLGLSEPAFESLMKAYLIDPMSPYVIACEKAVLPAWELMRRHSSPLPPQGPISDQERLKLLKEKRETDRLEQERAKWEQATSKPRILGNQEVSPPTKRGRMS